MPSRFLRHVWRALPGGLAAIATLGFSYLGVVTSLEQVSYRWLFKLRGPLPWDDRIVLITVDDIALKELAQYPISRDRYTQLLKQLALSQPTAIAMNLLFLDSTPADAALAEMIALQGNVVLAVGVNGQQQVLLPTPILNTAARATGHVFKEVEGDGLVHTIQPWIAQQTALGITLAEVYARRQPAIALPPLDQPLWINWPGPAAALPHYSLTEVLAGQVPPDTFDRKIVLVGITATGTNPLPTPFDENPAASGIVLHAAVLDNVLQQRYLHSIQGPWLWGVLLMMMPGVSYVLVGQALRWQLLVTGASLAAWLAVSLLVFQMYYWLLPVAPTLLFGLTGAASILGQRWRENFALQQLLDDLWHHYRQDTMMLAGHGEPIAQVAEELGDEVRKLALLAKALGRVQATQVAIAQTVPMGIVAVDDHDHVWFCNPLATQWLGLTQGDRLTAALVPDWLSATTWQQIRRDLQVNKPIASIEYQQDSTWFELCFKRLEGMTHSSPILQQAQGGILVLVEDVTHRKSVEVQLRLLNEGLESEVKQRSQELEKTNGDLQREILERLQAQTQLAHRALHDELTGLPSRHHFMTQLTQLLEQPATTETPQFAVLFLDCDRFKLVNDSFGHLVGDALLKAIAKRLRNCVAQQDIVARFGGDEFTLLLTELQTPQSVIYVAQRIRQRLQEPFFIQDCQLYTGCSIGIVLSGPNYDQAEDMLRDADTAMYRAKRGGFGYTLFEPEMHLEVRYSFQLETDLRQALTRQEFSVHYQPIVSISTQEIKGFEALLRWHHPTQGAISPNRFIPLAEETGLIVPIGQWVLKEACIQLRTWQQHLALERDVFMSVNLSVRQFNEMNLLAGIDKVLEETGLESRCLKLEITESAIIANSELAIKTFFSLKHRGIRLSIDDFGTGYSSLSYLHRFPIDVLKVDRSFIRRILDGRKHLSLVQAINTLARHFDMTMVAEGIENEQQLHYLQAMGCHLGQGYFFCPPVDKTTLETQYLSYQR